jgi:hypothetical protein
LFSSDPPGKYQDNAFIRSQALPSISFPIHQKSPYYQYYRVCNTENITKMARRIKMEYNGSVYHPLCNTSLLSNKAQESGDYGMNDKAWPE